MKKRLQNEKGFTLLEATIVVGIIAILMSAFSTGMARWLPDYRFSSYVMDLQGAIQQARIEAVRNNADVFFELDKDQGQFSVFLDNTADAAHSGVFDAGDTLITVYHAPEGVVFTSLFESGLDSALFTFNSRGISDTGGRICLKNTNEKYKGVNLTLAGSSRIIRSSDGSSWQ